MFCFREETEDQKNEFLEAELIKDIILALEKGIENDCLEKCELSNVQSDIIKAPYVY